MSQKVEKTPRQFVQEICGLSRISVSRVLNNPDAIDHHGVREELHLYLENSIQHVRKRRSLRAQKGQRH